MRACLRCLTLVDTNELLYVLCCSLLGQLKAVLLFSRYVDRYCGFRGLACAFVVCAEEEQVQQLKLKRGCVLRSLNGYLVRT